MPARVVHFEIPYDDAERARTFYTQAFGWQLAPMPGLDYTLASTGPVSESGQPTEPGYVNGGLLPRADTDAPSSVVVVDVEDIDAALRTVEASGGSVVTATTPVGEMGLAAYVKDTEGNVVGLWQTLTP